MKRFLLSASVACLFAGSAHGQAPANQYAVKASKVLSSTPLFTVGEVAILPVGVKRINGEDWYVLCGQYADGHTDCRKVADVELMRGIEVSTSIGKDGKTPLAWYLQTVSMSEEEAAHASFAIAVFNERLSQVANEFVNPRANAPTASGCATASAATRSGRESSSKARKECGTSDNPEPDPGRQSAAPHADARMQTVIITEDRPAPDWPTFDPPAPDPSAPPPPDYPGSSGDEPPDQQPDDSVRRVKALAETCIAVPPPFVGAACVIVHENRPPLPDPDTTPVQPPPAPPPRFDWCALAGIGCTGDQQPPDGFPSPMRNACNSRYITEAAECVQKRIRGETTRQDELFCMQKKQASLAKCLGEAPPLTSPAAG